MSGLIQEEKQQGVEVIFTKEEDAVKALLTRLKRIKTEKDVAIGSLLLHLQELQDEISVKSAPFDSATFAIENEITALMPAIARTLKTQDGAVSYRKGYIKVSWDTKALDACTDEYVKAAISPYRKETQAAPSIGKPEIY